MILGIETSCDDTSAALVDENKTIISQCTVGHGNVYEKYGGVVPEIASRRHMEQIYGVVRNVIGLNTSNNLVSSIDAIAVTSGPGLIGSLLVGVTFARGLALASHKPCIGINHLEGHALTPRLISDVAFPYLLLLISGGNSQIIIVHHVGTYEVIGQTLDDAVGEAFDKVGRFLKFDYPAGPAIDKCAEKGNPYAIDFPKSFFGAKHCNMSFSGIKTSVKRYVQKIGGYEKINEQQRADICASFQRAIAEVLCDRLKCAMLLYKVRCESNFEKHLLPKAFAVVGGAGANTYIRKKLNDFAQNEELDCIFPAPNLCTDNAAMIAWACIERIQSRAQSGLPYIESELTDQSTSETLIPRAVWSLDKLML